MAKILFIDNFDSFSYNLVDELMCLQHQVTVIRNNVALPTAQALANDCDMMVISPGPGGPQDAGICHSMIRSFAGKRPILGICLGHQLLVEAMGGRVERADVPVHGKVSLMTHNEALFFAGLPNPLRIGRYHSLVTRDIPKNYKVMAQVDDIIMCVCDEQQRLTGIQFHPESLLTTMGSKLLQQNIQYLLS